MEQSIGILAALGSCLVWAFSASHFQPAVHEHGAFACNLYKSAVATALFALTSLAMSALGDAGYGAPEALGMLALSGLVGMAFGDYALFAAIGHVGVRQAMLVHGTAPLFILVWSLLFPDSGLGVWDVVGILLVVAGVSAVTLAQRGRGRVGVVRPGVLVGTLWALAAALGQAGGILLSKEALATCHPVAGATVRLGGALLGLLLLQTLRGRLGKSLAIFAIPSVWRRIFLPSFFGTYLGIFLMMVAISRSNPAVAGALLATTPIFVIPAAFFVLKERVAPSVLFGTGIAVAGIAVVSAGLATS